MKSKEIKTYRLLGHSYSEIALEAKESRETIRKKDPLDERPKDWWIRRLVLKGSDRRILSKDRFESTVDSFSHLFKDEFASRLNITKNHLNHLLDFYDVKWPSTKKTFECPMCGEEVKKYPSQIKRNSYSIGPFCSDECWREYWEDNDE